MSSNINADLKQYSKDVQRLQHKNRQEVEKLRASYESQLESKDQIKEEVLNNIEVTYKEDKSDTSRAFEASINRTANQSQTKIESLNQRNTKTLRNIRRKHVLEMNEVKLHFNEELSQLKSTYKRIIEDKDRQLDETNRIHDKKYEYLAKKGQEKIDKVVERYSERILKLENAHRDEVNQLQKRVQGFES